MTLKQLTINTIGYTVITGILLMSLVGRGYDKNAQDDTSGGKLPASSQHKIQ